ncbi:MAG: glycosyltransferase family 2 protein [Bacteroidaceae bacterium]|nr:glycosyltransferase family 2 protein [Bacteroidaceae bacterium]
MKSIAIVILNWNGAGMLRKFLPSVLKYSPEAEVIVADNASSDDSLKVMESDFSEVRTIALNRNYGFAEGYNQALRQVEAEYYLLLNSDVEVTEGWLHPMLSYMDAHKEVVACQPKLRCEWNRSMLEYAGACGGYIDRLGYPFCRGRVFNTVEKDSAQYDTVVPVLWATGAALMIRSKLYWEAGGLDGRFFAHQEEIDLCWRLRSRGYQIVCIPESVVYHVGGASLPKKNSRKTFLNFRNNMILLYKNLSDDQLAQVMRWRFWLDALACVYFLLTLQVGSSLAVWRGRWAFRKMKADFRSDREKNMQAAVLPSSEVLFPKSILWQYHVKGKKTYSQLTNNN